MQAWNRNITIVKINTNVFAKNTDHCRMSKLLFLLLHFFRFNIK